MFYIFLLTIFYSSINSELLSNVKTEFKMTNESYLYVPYKTGCNLMIWENDEIIINTTDYQLTYPGYQFNNVHKHYYLFECEGRHVQIIDMKIRTADTSAA